MKRLASAALLLLGLTFATPPAYAGEPEPLHRYSDDRLPPPSARVNLFLTSATIFGLSYGSAVGASYLWKDSPGASSLRVPFAGPWMKVGRTRLCNADPDAQNCQDALRVIGAVFSVIDGLAQTGSLFFLMEGLWMSTAPLDQPASAAFSAPVGFRSGAHRNHHAHPRRGTLLSDGDFELRALPYSNESVDLGLGFVGTF